MMNAFGQVSCASGTSGHPHLLVADQRQLGRCRVWKTRIAPRAVLVLEPLAATSPDKAVLQPELPAAQQYDASPTRIGARRQRHRPSHQQATDLTQAADLEQQGQYSPNQQAPITSRQHAKQGHSHDHAQGQSRRLHAPHKPRRDAHALLHNIQTATTLKQLQQALHQGAQWLGAAHISAILTKTLQFAASDPRAWFTPPSPHHRNQQQPPTAWPSPQEFMQPPLPGPHGPWQHDDDGLHAPHPRADWGMSDDSDHPHGPSGRSPPAYFRPLDATTQDTAFRRLLSVVDRTASLAVHLTAHRQLGHHHATVVLDTLAQLGYRNQAVLSKVLWECIEGEGKPTPHNLTQCVWACAMLKMDPGKEWLAIWESTMMEGMGWSAPHVVCTSVCALGILGHKPSSTFMSATCTHTFKVLHKCRARDLANVCEGFASLGYAPDAAWTASFLSASKKRLPQFSIKDLQRTLASLALLECRPDQEWLDAFYTRCQELLSQSTSHQQPHGHMGQGGMLTTKQMASMAMALARLGLRPDMRWMDACLAQTRHEHPHATPEDLTQLLGALAALRYRPSESWMQGYLMVCFQRLGMYSPDQMVSQLHSLVRLGQRPSSIWLNELARKAQAQLHDYTGDQLAYLMSSLTRLHYHPPADWLDEWEVSSQGLLDQFSADALSLSISALAQIRHQPAVGWLYSFVLAAYSKLDAFGSAQLGMVFEALPRVSPHPGWLDELVQICASESIPGTGRGLSSMSIDELEDDLYPFPSLTANNTQSGSSTEHDGGDSSTSDTPQKAPAIEGASNCSISGSRLWMQMPSARDLAAGAESMAAPVALRTYGAAGLDGGADVDVANGVVGGNGVWVAAEGNGQAGGYEVKAMGTAVDGAGGAQGVQVMGPGFGPSNGVVQNGVPKLRAQASPPVPVDEQGVPLPLTQQVASVTCQAASVTR